MFLTKSGLTIGYLSEQLEIGVKNGYSVEKQIKLLEQVLNNNSRLIFGKKHNHIAKPRFIGKKTNGLMQFTLKMTQKEFNQLKKSLSLSRELFKNK